jgi:putative transposase
MYTKCLKYRLCPTKAQETVLDRTLLTCRDVYNSLLNERKGDYEVQGTSPSRYEQQKHFPVWSKEFPEVAGVFSQVLQNVAVRVDLAFKAFFRRVQAGETPGFPRVKGEGYDSFTYPQAGFKVHEQAVYLSKIGIVKAILHRPVEGKVKTCTVRRQSGKWYVCFAVEVETEPLPPSEENVGIDVGLKTFAALSNGEFIENPRFFRKDEKALAKAQRKADKLKHARSQEQKAKRRKAYKVVSRIHERIRNRRHDFVHQLSRKIVNRFGLIAVEKLNVKNMSKSPAPKPDPENVGQYLPNGASAKAGLNKSILDAAWSMFRSVLTYKAESASRQEVNVNPACPTGIPVGCSRCGQRVPKPLSERPDGNSRRACCGLVLDRDVNAARNILKIAVGQHSVPA